LWRNNVLSPENVKAMTEDFAKRLQGMLDLVARGRGIEILIRIADQTRDWYSTVSESYETMMAADIKVPNLHPPQSLPRLFSETEERERLEAARDIADKLAHALYRHARKQIDRYKEIYGLKTPLTSDGVDGWRVDAAGHLIEEDGRRIESIVDVIKTSDENLIVEEYDVFVHNNYAAAAREIFDDAWQRIAAGQTSLAIQVARLHMFRGFRRGKRNYVASDSRDQ
jgi:hypothetical protein